MSGENLLTFLNMRQNEVSCFKDSLMLFAMVLLNLFVTALLFAHELCTMFRKLLDQVLI